MSLKFQVYNTTKSKKGILQTRWRLLDGDDIIACGKEPFHRSHALGGVRDLVHNLQGKSRFPHKYIIKSTSSFPVRYYWVLKARNGKLVACGTDSYKTSKEATEKILWIISEICRQPIPIERIKRYIGEEK